MKSVDDAMGMAELDVNMLGLVFAPSTRRITPQLAREISQKLKQKQHRPALVGIFVNEALQTVNDTAAYCGLDIVQFSGDERWDYCRKLEHPFIKVIHITGDSTSAGIIADLEAGYSSGLKRPFVCMLDCKSEGKYGGSGSSFNWNVAEKPSFLFPLIIAGGLHAGNVGMLLRHVRPAGVDVSSGVESNGKKDFVKVEEFVRVVRLAGNKTEADLEIINTLLRTR